MRCCERKAEAEAEVEIEGDDDDVSFVLTFKRGNGDDTAEAGDMDVAVEDEITPVGVGDEGQTKGEKIEALAV